MPKISVIIPCYNVSSWVAQCLDSLVNQTLSDIEIICVDDKSVDDTLKIIKEYAKKDKRIKIIAHKNNMGVSVARNDGLSIATGQYIGFVDPDDFVDKDFYEKLYNKAVETNADVVKGGVIIVDLQNGKKSQKKEIFKHISEFAGGFWSAIYRLDFLKQNDIKFNNNLIIGEDTLFLTEVCLKTTKIVYFTDVCYNYFYQRPGSLDSRLLSHKRVESIYESIEKRIRLIEGAGLKGKDFELFMDRHILSQLEYNIFKNFEFEDDRKKIFDLLVSIYKKYGMKKYLLKRFKKCRLKCIKKSDYFSFINFQYKRIFLFGFLPFVRIERCFNKTYVKLFEIIPLFKIR